MSLVEIRLPKVDLEDLNDMVEDFLDLTQGHVTFSTGDQVLDDPEDLATFLKDCFGFRGCLLQVPESLGMDKILMFKLRWGIGGE